MKEKKTEKKVPFLYPMLHKMRYPFPLISRKNEHLQKLLNKENIQNIPPRNT